MFFIAKYFKSELKPHTTEDYITRLRHVNQNVAQIAALEKIRDTHQSKYINVVKKKYPIEFGKVLFKQRRKIIDVLVEDDKMRNPVESTQIDHTTIAIYKQFCNSQKGLDAQIRALNQSLKENPVFLKAMEKNYNGFAKHLVHLAKPRSFNRLALFKRILILSSDNCPFVSALIPI